MKVIQLAVLLGTIASTLAFAEQKAVKFDVVLTRNGTVVSSPSVVGEFGKQLVAEQGGVMKVDATADSPGWDGLSATSVKLYLFENGAMKPVKEMSMRADLSKTPSFEYSVPGTNARFVVKPRLVTVQAKS
jgi:hypothetical protein